MSVVNDFLEVSDGMMGFLNALLSISNMYLGNALLAVLAVLAVAAVASDVNTGADAGVIAPTVTGMGVLQKQI